MTNKKETDWMYHNPVLLNMAAVKKATGNKFSLLALGELNALLIDSFNDLNESAKSRFTFKNLKEVLRRRLNK